LSVPVLATTRLVLRAPTEADADDVLVFRGDPEVQRLNDTTLPDRDAVVAFLELLRHEGAMDRRRHWAIEQDGTVIGLVGLHAWQAGHRRAELGFDLRRDRWGRGLALEACRAVLAHGFGPLGLNRVEACADAANARSIGLLERLGFRHEGTRRQYVWEDDGWHDSLVFGLLAGERP
jgi:[ribosomal protein S5]-alanine N-acetyltransferase